MHVCVRTYYVLALFSIPTHGYGHRTQTHTIVRKYTKKWNFLQGLFTVFTHTQQSGEFNFILSLLADWCRFDRLTHNGFISISHFLFVSLVCSKFWSSIQRENSINLRQLIGFWNGNNLLGWALTVFNKWWSNRKWMEWWRWASIAAIAAFRQRNQLLLFEYFCPQSLFEWN